MNSLSKAISNLWFDYEVVNRLKDKEVNKAILYTHLISGKISLKEYLSII
ncbi:MAG: hypothetical protein LH478_12390 [Chitinophagaceae bacterium]|nr:hypothetical protein [Chitinophagaceae bacterium]